MSGTTMTRFKTAAQHKTHAAGSRRCSFYLHNDTYKQLDKLAVKSGLSRNAVADIIFQKVIPRAKVVWEPHHDIEIE